MASHLVFCTPFNLSLNHFTYIFQMTQIKLFADNSVKFVQDLHLSSHGFKDFNLKRKFFQDLRSAQRTEEKYTWIATWQSNFDSVVFFYSFTFCSFIQFDENNIYPNDCLIYMNLQTWGCFLTRQWSSSLWFREMHRLCVHFFQITIDMRKLDIWSHSSCMFRKSDCEWFTRV